MSIKCLTIKCLDTYALAFFLSTNLARTQLEERSSGVARMDRGRLIHEDG